MSLLIFDQSFQKPKGGPFGEKKNLKKLDFDVCDAIKVHFVIILFITQVPSVKLLKLVFSRRLMTEEGKCVQCGQHFSFSRQLKRTVIQHYALYHPGGVQGRGGAGDQPGASAEVPPQAQAGVPTGARPGVQACAEEGV